MQVFVQSFGCSTNFADGEVLAGCLAEAGYEVARSCATADVIIYNTCAVKGPTENRMIEILKRVPKSKKLIVAGCLPLINFERLEREVRFDGAVGPAAGDRIIEVVRHVLKDEKVLALKGADEAMPNLALPRIHLNPVISIIPMNYGCLGSCAYCCVTFARGRLRSYSVEEITERLEKDLSQGVQEVWLTSQDTACYGRDLGTNLAHLLDVVCSIKGDFKVRVGMMNPNTAKDFLKELIESFQDEHVFKFLHLPLQSGDEEVLKSMRRFYSPEDFKSILKSFRTHFPKLTISTDVICGFPRENESAFNRTLQLIQDVKPDIANVSKFFARPRTAAAQMHNGLVSPRDIKLRTAKMAYLAKQISLAKNRSWLNWTGEVLIDEVGKIPKSFIGRNFAYKPIAVKSSRNLLGKTLTVRIFKAFSTHLEGKIVE
jgi:MiaB-like tRNA modifying enzyme